MRILAGMEGGWRTIRGGDADRGQRAALVELGFGPDLVRRYPPGTRHFDRAVANLGQWLDEMVRQRMTGTAPGTYWTCSGATRRRAWDERHAGQPDGGGTGVGDLRRVRDADI